MAGTSVDKVIWAILIQCSMVMTFQSRERKPRTSCPCMCIRAALDVMRISPEGAAIAQGERNTRFKLFESHPSNRQTQQGDSIAIIILPTVNGAEMSQPKVTERASPIHCSIQVQIQAISTLHIHSGDGPKVQLDIRNMRKPKRKDRNHPALIVR